MDKISEQTTTANVPGFVVPLGMKSPFMTKKDYADFVKNASKSKKSRKMSYPLLRWDYFLRK